MAESFDVIVIGGGPGGYVAAIRAAQLGLNTAVVEKDKPGGRCLNYACIPAKTMLHSAEVLDHAQNSADLGVKVSKASIDWKALGERRASVSETLSGGVKMLWDKNKITQIEGEGSLTDDGNVEGRRRDVRGEEHRSRHRLRLAAHPRGRVLRADRRHVGRVVASGPAEAPCDGRCGRLRLRDRVGLRPLRHRGDSHRDARRRSSRSRTRTAPESSSAPSRSRASRSPPAPPSRTSRRPASRSSSSTARTEGEADYLVIAGGRAPDTDPLNLSGAGVETEENGKIKIDELQRTTNSKVFAIGDLVRGPALAHKASEEGVVAVETIAGAPTHAVDSDLIPGATFCHPQVASVGLTEAEAKEQGHDIKVGRFKLGGVGASAVYDDREGMVKIVAESEYGEIIGAHIVGNSRLRHDLGDRERDRARGRLSGARPHRPPAPDDVRSHPRRGPRRRRLGDARLVPEPASFYYDLGSPYAYLSAERIHTVFEEAGAPPPVWKPVLLGGLFAQFDRGSWALTDAREEGMREVERRAAAYGLPPIRWPEGWPSNYLFAMRVATFATEIGRGVSLPLAAFRQHFAAGRDLSEPDNVLIAAASAELHPRALTTAVKRNAIKERLRADHRRGGREGRVRRAGDRGRRGEVFWGDDRLEEAAERAAIVA